MTFFELFFVIRFNEALIILDNVIRFNEVLIILEQLESILRLDGRKVFRPC